MRIIALTKLVFFAFWRASSVVRKNKTIETSDSVPQVSALTCGHIQGDGIDENSLLQKASRLNTRESVDRASLAQVVSGEVKPSRRVTGTSEDYASNDSISVVFPGFGEADRREIMKGHIALLRKQSVPLDCTVFVYRNETEFPLNSSDFLPCTILRHQGFYAEHIKAFRTNASRRPWILLWTDSVVLDETTDFARMISVAKANQLDHLAITFDPGNKSFHKKKLARNGDGVGYRCRAPEFQLDLIRRAAFECLQNEGIDDVNPTFWGVPFFFAWACKPQEGVWDEVLWEKFDIGSQTRTPQDKAKVLANVQAQLKKAQSKGFPSGTHPYSNFPRLKLEPLIDPNSSNV